MATSKKLFPNPVVRREQIVEIAAAPTAEDRLFRFLQFVRWLENSMKRPWKHPLQGIGTDLFYRSDDANLNTAHRRLSQANRTWARYGHVVIKQLKIDRDEFQRLNGITKRNAAVRGLHSNVQTPPLSTTTQDQCRNRTYLSEIRSSDKPEYMTFLCQVIGVVKTKTGETVLRVWDGSQHRLGAMYPRKMFVTERSMVAAFCVPPSTALGSVPDDYLVDIICQGEWAAAALSLKSGQTLCIRSVHLFWPTSSPPSVPRKLFLRGGSANNRGIHLLPSAMARVLADNLQGKVNNLLLLIQHQQQRAMMMRRPEAVSHHGGVSSIKGEVRGAIVAGPQAQPLIEDAFPEDSFFISSESDF